MGEEKFPAKEWKSHYQEELRCQQTLYTEEKLLAWTSCHTFFRGAHYFP
jgi:hypothetical protein